MMMSGQVDHLFDIRRRSLAQVGNSTPGHPVANKIQVDITGLANPYDPVAQPQFVQHTAVHGRINHDPLQRRPYDISFRKSNRQRPLAVDEHITTQQPEAVPRTEHVDERIIPEMLDPIMPGIFYPERFAGVFAGFPARSAPRSQQYDGQKKKKRSNQSHRNTHIFRLNLQSYANYRSPTNRNKDR